MLYQKLSVSSAWPPLSGVITTMRNYTISKVIFCLPLDGVGSYHQEQGSFLPEDQLVGFIQIHLSNMAVVDPSFRPCPRGQYASLSTHHTLVVIETVL